jgi:hypothetical protein
MMPIEAAGSGDTGAGSPEGYVAPALELLGTLEDLTRGPDPGAGDVPTGVISL